MSSKISTLQVANAFISWLFSIVKRECYRLLRIRRKELPIDSIPEPQDEDKQNGMQLLMVQEIITAINNLPPVYQQVLVMRDVEEMTGPEVAATLGITIEAVKSRLYRARNMVRTALNTPE